MWKVEFISNKPQLLTANLELKLWVICHIRYKISQLKQYDKILVYIIVYSYILL